MENVIYIFIVLVFLSPLIAIPMLGICSIALKVYELSKDLNLRFKTKNYTPPKIEQNPDLLLAESFGFSPELKITPQEILKNHGDLTQDRVIEIGKVIYPPKYWNYFKQQEATPDKDKIICSLFLQMAFFREFMIRNEPGLWSNKSEEQWAYHCPKSLRKLKPDFYTFLLGQCRANSKAS